MAFILGNIIVLALAALVSWWLSGYDAKLTGENETEDRIRRGIRCGITLVLVEIAFWNLWRYWRYEDQIAGVTYITTAVPFALIWVGCITEFLARGFNWLIDPEDHEEFDPNKSERDLDAIGSLIKSGRKEEAIQLCQTLKESGAASVLAMDMTLEHLGVPQSATQTSNPLIQAGRLREQGKFQEAESILNSLLRENPANVAAAIMLMRLYAQDMRRSGKASEILRSLEKQPYISSSHVEYARRSIEEWRNSQPKKEAAIEPMPESIEELLEQGYFGRAIEILEQKIKEQPRDFDLLMKLAEAYGKYCGNFHRAEKIVRQIETGTNFSPKEKEFAETKLKEWREARTRPST